MTTQRAIFSYEEVIDLHTEADTVSVIGIHTPTGDTARKLCPGFFQQFKKYKYLGCSVALVPAATLPADPLSVSYEAGEPTIDPRDMLNPIMFHGCHGNDIGNILNRLYSSGLADSSDLTQIMHSDSTDFMSMYNGMDDGTPVLQILESLYYRALTDKTWKKANIQRGFRKSGLKPRIYSLATNMQLMGQTSLGTQRAPGIIEGTVDLTDPFNPNMNLEDPVVNPVRYFTPRTVPLGWLDTRQVVPYVAEGTMEDVTFDELNATITDLVKGKTVWNELPLIYMGIILMPPAYKTEQYFRMVINHHFAFAGFRGISMSNDMIEMPPNYEDWNDAISSHESDPPGPEPPGPVGTSYSLADLVASGAPNIGTTPYNTYDKVVYGGYYEGTVSAVPPSALSQYTVDAAEFAVPQSVARNPSEGGDPIGYHVMLVNGVYKREYLGYNGSYWRRTSDDGTTWTDWSDMSAQPQSAPTVTVSGDDLSVTSIAIGGTTKYEFTAEY